MAANVEEMFSSGMQVPWHGLGTVVGEAPTSAEAMRLAGLDWRVRKLSITQGFDEDTGDVYTLEQQERDYVIIRTIPGEYGDRHDVLGTVGPQYTMLQNVDAFSFMDTLLQNGSGVHYDTAGSLDEGRKVWLLANLPGGVRVGDDISNTYMLLSNTHDGSGSITVRGTAIRVVCQNTLRMALAAPGGALKVRHTRSMQERMATATKVLEIGGTAQAALQERADAMAAQQIRVEEWRAFRDLLVPLPPVDQSATKSRNDRDSLDRLFEGGEPGLRVYPEQRGTVWAAAQSATAFVSHVKTVRGESGSRLDSVWNGSGQKLLAQADDLLDEIIGGLGDRMVERAREAERVRVSAK